MLLAMYKCAITLSTYPFPPPCVLLSSDCCPSNLRCPMKPPPYHPTRLVGNIAALVLLALGAAYLLDRTTRWFGYPTNAFCGTVNFFAPLYFAIGVIMATLGVLVWASSNFKGGAGVGLFLGGMALTTLPPVMPHYFGVMCIQ